MPGLRAVLLHADEPDRDTVLVLQQCSPFPPTRVLVPGDFAGAAAFDVYELADGDGWPEEAVYWHTRVVPRTTADSDTSEHPAQPHRGD